MDESVKITEIVKIGTAIRTKHGQSNNWVNNIILNVDIQTIEIDIGMENDYLKSIVMVGDTVKCKYLVDTGEYVLLGWITNIDAGFPQKMTIRIHDVNFYENIRAYFRYDVFIGSVIKLNEKSEKGFFAVMTNISSGGAAFSVKKDIKEELAYTQYDSTKEIYIFEIFVSNNKTFCFHGEVVRRTKKEKGIEYGVKLYKIDKENNVIMESFIKDLENKNKEEYNKKSSFWTKNSKYFKGD